MNFLNYLKDLAKKLLFVIYFWCALSFIASFFQAMVVNSGSASCETETYIEYVVFTDLFCEVQK